MRHFVDRKLVYRRQIESGFSFKGPSIVYPLCKFFQGKQTKTTLTILLLNQAYPAFLSNYSLFSKTTSLLSEQSLFVDDFPVPC